MSGLVRDIRAIPSPRTWRRFGVAAAGLLLLVAALAVIQTSGLLKSFKGFHLGSFSQPTKTVSENVIWSARPGEWVLFGADVQPGVGYYFKPSATKKIGDYVVLTVRNPFKPADTPRNGPLGAYQDGRQVFDCKKNISATSEATIYNRTGEIISHFKRAEPEAVDPSVFITPPPGSVLSMAMRVACDEAVATSLGDQVKNTKLTYLSGTQTGDGDIFFGPTKKPSEPPYQYEALVVTKMFQDHSLTEIFAVKPVLNDPATFRSFAQVGQFNCTEKKGQTFKIDEFDAQGNLVAINLLAEQKIDVMKEGTVFAGVLSRVCGTTATNVAGTASAANVSGTYEGTITTSYKKGGQGDQKISITIEQTVWNDFKVAYKTAAGGQGQGTGKFENGTAESISLQSTTPGCPGSYEASLKFDTDSVTFSFKGEDCSGPMEGNGTAKKVKT
jgi:hypothetical protein